ncbi:hypothetical protein CAI21_17445 [Alkalilimnicola ehrlichii]|uniref:Uncharacterized protein n=1 Tax=Alkalilimnicola ehrlichii TaxID=351052 RepID=A0A3E0WLF9_9GAMM|nr:hypothetical protein CAI21_17445 [Alkalilimnicola ehrlichii]RFA33249.1 hypothetical protein CAL65_17930 [Alkalilimnicola ehrlichii]
MTGKLVARIARRHAKALFEGAVELEKMIEVDDIGNLGNRTLALPRPRKLPNDPLQAQFGRVVGGEGILTRKQVLLATLPGRGDVYLSRTSPGVRP